MLQLRKSTVHRVENFISRSLKRTQTSHFIYTVRFQFANVLYLLICGVTWYWLNPSWIGSLCCRGSTTRKQNWKNHYSFSSKVNFCIFSKKLVEVSKFASLFKNLINVRFVVCFVFKLFHKCKIFVEPIFLWTLKYNLKAFGKIGLKLWPKKKTLKLFCLLVSKYCTFLVS
jgi:hypothetical protein